MAATKLLLLLFSVVLLGLTSADVEDNEPFQENSVLSSESEEVMEPSQDTILEEQDSRENQGKKLLSKFQDKRRNGGKQGPAGPHGNDGGSGSRFSQNKQKEGGQKSEKPRGRPSGPSGNSQKNRALDAKKRKGGR